jgi:hypothetical protein
MNHNSIYEMVSCIGGKSVSNILLQDLIDFAWVLVTILMNTPPRLFCTYAWLPSVQIGKVPPESISQFAGRFQMAPHPFIDHHGLSHSHLKTLLFRSDWYTEIGLDFLAGYLYCWFKSSAPAAHGLIEGSHGINNYLPLNPSQIPAWYFFLAMTDYIERVGCSLQFRATRRWNWNFPSSTQYLIIFIAKAVVHEIFSGQRSSHLHSAKSRTQHGCKKIQ